MITLNETERRFCADVCPAGRWRKTAYLDRAAMREIATRFFSDPEFRAFLEGKTWEINNPA